VKDRVVRVLHALLSGRNTQDIDCDVKIASAQFHDACSTLRKDLRKGRLFNTGRITEGSEVVILYEGEELHGTIVKLDDDTCFFDIDSVPNYRNESDFIRRNSESAWERQPIGTLFPLDNENRLGRVCSLTDSETRCDVLIGHSRKSLILKTNKEWLGSEILQNRPYNIPVFTNYEIFQSIVRKFLEQDWLVPSKALVASVGLLLKSTVDEVINQDRQIKCFPRLQRLLQNQINQEINISMECVNEEVVRFVRREQTPYTQNHYLNETMNDLRLERLLRTVGEAVDDYSLEDQRGHSSELRSVFEKMIRQAQRNKSIEDHMEEEMEDALQAYGKVAYKRFVDGIPMICGDAMLSCPETIRLSLAKVSDEDLEKVLSLSSSDLERREALKRKLNDLEQGLSILDDLFISSTSFQCLVVYTSY